MILRKLFTSTVQDFSKAELSAANTMQGDIVRAL